jgi:hypothetical protein
VTPEEVEQVRLRLEAFAADMLGGLARADQQARSELYLHLLGLLLDGKRKSTRRKPTRPSGSLARRSSAFSRSACFLTCALFLCVHGEGAFDGLPDVVVGCSGVVAGAGWAAGAGPG